jgi:hypothetical protein
LSHLLNLIWLSPNYGPKVDPPSTGTAQGLGHMHSANSCAVPCFAENPGMYQQSSFPVITLFSSEWPFDVFIVFSDATLRCSRQQSKYDDGPIHHGLAYCFGPFCTVEFTGNGVTDCPRPSCVVRGFKRVSVYFDSSFHRVRRLPPDSYTIYLFGSQDWTVS